MIETKIIDNTITQIKKILIEQKETILCKISQNLNVDSDGDEIDKIQANLILETSNHLEARDIAKISMIDLALKRIEGNIYGVCEDCEESIPEKRLFANPYCLTCVFCAEERERDLKQRIIV